MQGPVVDFELFASVASGIVAGGIALAGFLARRQAADHKQVAGRLAALETKVDRNSCDTTVRHDNNLADVWQAIEHHREDTRRNAADAERRSNGFREATLRELGDIKVTLARLESRLPAVQPAAGE